MSIAGLPEFWTFQRRLFSMDVIGQDQSWAAPVAKLFAPGGFGEESWIEEMPDSVIALHLSGPPVTKARGVGAGKTSACGGNVTLQGRGTANHYAATGSITFAQIILRDALLERASELARQPKLSGRLRPDLIFDECPHLNEAARSYVRRALDPRAPATTLEMEGRAFILIDRLLALHGNTRPAAPQCGGLAPWQLRRVKDFMRDHAQEDLLLEDLASLVDLSAKHFARAFRQSTGLPPHRWLVNQRIDQARGLLSKGESSLAQIALACGFADQSHFSVAFRKATGATPGAYRREARS
jgi:AraC family transcriptional regulator